MNAMFRPSVQSPLPTTPLAPYVITPGRISRPDWPRAFLAVPPWAGRIVVLADRVGLIVDGAVRRSAFLPPAEFAVLVELTRFGGEVTTEGRPGAGRDAEYVVALALPGLPDATPIRALLSGAAEDPTQPPWAQIDFSAVNRRYARNPVAMEAARAPVLATAYAVAHEAIGPTLAAVYVENIGRLLATVDGAGA